MMKWLRAHTKQIMVAVVLLAMFSFVGGPSLVNILAGNQAATVVMKVFDREVTQGELNGVQGEGQALNSLLLRWKYDREQKMTIQHWLMLAEEAQRAGIVIPEQRITEIIEIRDKLRQDQGYPSLEALRSQRRISRGLLKRAVARHLAIQENAGRVLGAAFPSDSQIKHYVHQTQDQVKIKYAALDAARFVDQTEVIPEEEMRAHFEKYKDVLPEESETGFGYRYPRRVTIQYVTALVSEAERSVKVSLDEIKAHWKGEDDLGNRNRDKYEKTVYVDDPAAPTTAPSSQPAEPPKQIPQQVKMMFSEAKPQIEKELRHKKGIKIARAAMNALARELAKPWNAVPTDKESGYKPIPSEEVKASDFMEKASDRIEAEYGIRLNYDAPEPFSKDALAANPLLGKGKTPGTDAVEIADYAFHVKGFYEPDDASDSTLRLQLYQTPDTPLVVQGKFSRPEFDPMANRWFVKPAEPETFILFRVIDARASAPPSSLENVRAGVEQDIRLMHAFSAMETAVQEFYAVAARLGVDEAFNRFSDYQTERGLSRINTPPAFARNQGLQGDALWEAVSAGKPPWAPSSVVGVGKSEGFIDACFALTAEDWAPPVMDLPQTDRVKAATSQPATETPKKVCLYSELKLRKWFVIELVQNLPVNTRTYEDIHRKGGMSALLNARMTVLRDAWYDPGQIEQRCRYVNVLGAPTPDSREGLQAPPPEKPAGSNL